MSGACEATSEIPGNLKCPPKVRELIAQLEQENRAAGMAYVSLEVSLSVWYAASREPLVPPAVTAFGTTIALMVLAYMLRLKKHGKLA
jgi:hypothetical protein